MAAGTGPLLGGLLVAHLGWRAVFLVNVPVALAIAALTLAVRVPAMPRARSGRTDLVTAALFAAVLAVLVHSLAGVPERGWAAPRTLLGLVLVVCLAAGLVMRERRSAEPFVPPAVARSVPVVASMAILLVTSGGMFGALFVSTFALQNSLGLDPLTTGLRVLPLTVLMVLGAPAAHAMLRRYGARRAAITGQVLVVLAIVGLSALGPAGPWMMWSATFAVLGAGFAVVMVTATGTVVGDAPPGYAGVVGGLKQTAMNVGPTLGIAVAAGTMPLHPAADVLPGAELPASGPVMGTALLVLAALAALGLLPASLLPSRPGRDAGREGRRTLRRCRAHPEGAAVPGAGRRRP